MSSNRDVIGDDLDVILQIFTIRHPKQSISNNVAKKMLKRLLKAYITTNEVDTDYIIQNSYYKESL